MAAKLDCHNLESVLWQVLDERATVYINNVSFA